MKKKVAILLSMLLVTSVVFAGCGKNDEESSASVNEANVVSEDNLDITEDVSDSVSEDSVIDAVYDGRFYTDRYVPYDLSLGATFGTLPAEGKYFDYLYTKWVDDSWNDSSVAEDSVFYKDIFTAIKNGIYDKMTTTIADYTEIETEMAKVYKGIEAVENTINEDYVNVALADIAGFNGVHFTTETSINDVVPLGVVLDTAAIFAKDDSFKDAPYTEKEIGDGSILNQPATGRDINYAFAVALGLDTADPAQALKDAGYSSFDDSVATVSLATYDRVAIINAKIFALGSTEPAVVEKPAEESGTTTTTTEPSTTEQKPAGDTGTTSTEQKPAEESGTTPATEEKPAETTPAGNGKTVTINGVEYTVGGTTPSGVYVDDPAYYNHPEAAIMTVQELCDRAYPIDHATGTMNYDASWEQDMDTRSMRVGDF